MTEITPKDKKWFCSKTQTQLLFPESHKLVSEKAQWKQDAHGNKNTQVGINLEKIQHKSNRIWNQEYDSIDHKKSEEIITLDFLFKTEAGMAKKRYQDGDAVPADIGSQGTCTEQEDNR